MFRTVNFVQLISYKDHCCDLSTWGNWFIMATSSSCRFAFSHFRKSAIKLKNFYDFETYIKVLKQSCAECFLFSRNIFLTIFLVNFYFKTKINVWEDYNIFASSKGWFCGAPAQGVDDKCGHFWELEDVFYIYLDFSFFKSGIHKWAFFIFIAEEIFAKRELLVNFAKFIFAN